MLALVRAKRAEFIQELECDDPRELMNPEMSKWEKVSVSVNASNGICCYRSPEACKYKWQTLLPDYKRVADVHKETGVNSMLYFEMTFGEKRTRTLPKNFDQHVYSEMHDWLKHKPTITPPHFRDLMSPTDGNYMAPPVTEDMGQSDLDKQPSLQDLPPSFEAYGSAAAYDARTDTIEEDDNTPEETTASAGGNQTLPNHPPAPPQTASTATFFPWNATVQSGPSSQSLPPMDVNGRASSSPIPGGLHFIGRTAGDGEIRSPSLLRRQGQRASPTLRRQVVPPPSAGASPGERAPCTSSSPLRPPGCRQSDPHLLSSDTSAARTSRQSSGNTGVRRKSHAGIKMVADATLEGSERLLEGLKEINETTKVLKTQEMEMELRMHQDEMKYREGKDEKQLQNARLALQNQSAVVAAMASLADAIRGVRGPPQSQPPNDNLCGHNVAAESVPAFSQGAPSGTCIDEDSNVMRQ
jgi:hypothetical protein